MTRDEQFDMARKRVISEEHTSDGFTVLAERAVHKMIKLYLEPRVEYHEVPTLGSVADICNESGITEVQTGSFAPLIPKLKKFLPETGVTLVHPLIALTRHRWLSRETGEISAPKRGGRPKTLHSIAFELYKIREFLTHKNFTLRVIFLECEEFRALDGWDRTRKRGATLIEKLPTKILDDITLTSREDYRILLPDTLGERFLAKDYMRAIKSRSRYDIYNLKLLSELQFITRTGKSGNAYIYTRL